MENSLEFLSCFVIYLLFVHANLYVSTVINKLREQARGKGVGKSCFYKLKRRSFHGFWIIINKI